MAKKRKFNARKMMELAVDVMHRTVGEPRDDGKASPLVGAVLVKEDGSVETASRGELRHGDHAEFTLLERKNRSVGLDGSILFCTLEPCAPGSRRHPKLGCAERIVLARIKEVWIGIEDPDPTVDRKGIKFLQDKGIAVHMFDRDLQDKIREANSLFIEQAEERAAAAREEKPTEPPCLSALEDAQPLVRLEDLDAEALEGYRKALTISDDIHSDVFIRRLHQQGLLKTHNNILVPTGFGLLLFGKEARASMPQAGLLGTIHFPDGSEETKDFDGPAVLAPGEALQWLRDKLPNPIDRSSAQRKELNEGLYELVREGLVNGLVHRNYAIDGAKCQLVVSPEKIVVMSPGLPVEPITFEQLAAFNAPMLSRNPVLHFVFAKLALAEERGLGLKSMRKLASKAGMPLPIYHYKAPYVVLTIFREAKSALIECFSGALENLNKAEIAGWEWIVSHESVTTAEYREALALPSRTAKNHIKKFVDLGMLEKLGAGKATKYRVLFP